MANMFSELCRRNKVEESAINELISKKRDFDIDLLDRKLRKLDEERREFVVRAYSKSDVSKPAMPNFSLSYDPQLLIADLVSPVIPGSIERQFPTWATRRDVERILNNQIASDGSIGESGLDIVWKTYVEKPYGNKHVVDLNKVAQSSQVIDVMQAHQMSVYGDSLLAREKRVADKYMTAANYATGCTSAIGAGNNRWDVGVATSTAEPLRDIRITMKTAVELGPAPNVAIASTPVLEYLRIHPKVVAAAGTKSSDRRVSDDELAKLIGVERIIEGKAKYDTAGNTGTASRAFLWGKGFVLARVTPGASLGQQTFMKTFRHTDLSLRDERVGNKGVRGLTELIVTHEDADEIVMADAAYLLDTVIS